MKKILYINTSDQEIVEIRLLTNGKELVRRARRKRNSQIVLELIDKILKEGKIKPQALDELQVYTGPGSYTGLRVGISIGNALAKALDIKINGHKQIVDAMYK